MLNIFVVVVAINRLFKFLFLFRRNEDLLVHLIANSLLSLNALNDDAKNELDLAFRAAKSNDFWLENRPFSLADRKEYLSTGVGKIL